MEASGGYERPLLDALHSAGLAVARVQAGAVRHFARAQGQRAKTDRIDAQVLAQFGRQMGPAPTVALPESHKHLRALVARRRVLVETRAAESKRLLQGCEAMVMASIRGHLAWLEAEISGLERAIRTAITACRESARRDALLRSLPGIGPATAAVLMAELPELGRVDGGQIAAVVFCDRMSFCAKPVPTFARHALAGLAPFARQSDGWRGKSYISGGRKPPRDALYMAATSVATRGSSRFRSQYLRLREAGKPHKLALVAVMRKMLVTLNAMVKADKPFDA